MSDLPLHPKLVHLPMALAVLVPLLTSGLLLAWWRGWLPKRTWLVACSAQALLLASGWLALRTGEQDEDRVERLVPESALEAHEDAAETFVWGSGIVLALALLPLLLGDGKRARLLALGTAAASTVVLVLGVRVGQAGGELVYRHGAASAFVQDAGPASGAPPSRKHGGEPIRDDPHAAPGGPAGLRLDDGRKWRSNATTHAAMRAMQQLLDGFASSGAADLRALGASLRDHSDEIIRTCTMTGEPHRQLHLLLNPMLETIEELASGRGSSADVGVLREHLRGYFAHFEP